MWLMDTFLSNFRPLQPFFGSRRNNANLLGKCGQLVLVGLVPNTTKPYYYGEILWDLTHNIIPYTLNGRIINSFLHLLKFAQLWSISRFRLVKPKLTQMHPNDFKLCMEDIEGY